MTALSLNPAAVLADFSAFDNTDAKQLESVLQRTPWDKLLSLTSAVLPDYLDLQSESTIRQCIAHGLGMNRHITSISGVANLPNEIVMQLERNAQMSRMTEATLTLVDSYCAFDQTLPYCFLFQGSQASARLEFIGPLQGDVDLIVEFGVRGAVKISMAKSQVATWERFIYPSDTRLHLESNVHFTPGELNVMKIENAFTPGASSWIKEVKLLWLDEAIGETIDLLKDVDLSGLGETSYLRVDVDLLRHYPEVNLARALSRCQGAHALEFCRFSDDRSLARVLRFTKWEDMASVATVLLYKTTLGPDSESALENAIKRCPSITTISDTSQDWRPPLGVTAALYANRISLNMSRRTHISFSQVFLSQCVPPSIYMSQMSSTATIHFFGPAKGNLILSLTHRNDKSYEEDLEILIGQRHEHKKRRIENERRRSETPEGAIEDSMQRLLKQVVRSSKTFYTDYIMLLPDENFDPGQRNTLLIRPYDNPSSCPSYDPAYEILDIQVLGPDQRPWEGVGVDLDNASLVEVVEESSKLDDLDEQRMQQQRKEGGVVET